MAPDTSSSFTTTRLNSTTFLITEDDSFHERPYIYAKLHPSAPVLILNDTGCNSPSSSSSKARFIHLRDYLENCPVSSNDNKPLNPGTNRRHYLIICSHCHYDHTLGIPQFLQYENASTSTQIIASSFGRDFIESDLANHGLFEYLKIPTPQYTVTHWAQSFERLTWKSPSASQRVDLDITLIPTPGHTPDSLAWYDHTHMHLYVGDSLYEEGPAADAAIIWPPHGNIVDWYYSLSKMLQFTRKENHTARQLAADLTPDLYGEGWEVVERRVKLAAGHKTSSGDAENLIESALRFLGMVLRDEIPPWDLGENHGEKLQMWRKDGYGMYFAAPQRLMDDAKRFFGNEYGW